METVLIEILAGGGIETAFKELGIEAKCTYNQTKTPHYEVWEIAEDDMFMMDLVSNWPQRYGWWTYSEGSNMGGVNHDITINGKPITAWMRDGLMDDLRRDWERETKKNKEVYDFDFAKYAEELNIENHVRYLGWRNDIRNLYYMSDICTASSIREGFGLNIAEAMLCSTPVIATKNRGHNTIIKDGHNGYLINQGDENAFAEKILSLINNEKKREMLISNASRDAEKYTTDVVLKDLYNILSSHIQEEK